MDLLSRIMAQNEEMEANAATEGAGKPKAATKGAGKTAKKARKSKNQSKKPRNGKVARRKADSEDSGDSENEGHGQGRDPQDVAGLSEKKKR